MVEHNRVHDTSKVRLDGTHGLRPTWSLAIMNVPDVGPELVLAGEAIFSVLAAKDMTGVPLGLLTMTDRVVAS